MGTAVLHPHECLRPPQSHPSGGFLILSEYAAAAPSVSVFHDAPMNSCGSRSSLDTASRGILGCRDSSAGLLPRPDLVPQIAYSPDVKLSPYSYKRRRSPASAHSTAKPMRRCSSSLHDLSSHGMRQPAGEDRGNAEPGRLREGRGVFPHSRIALSAKIVENDATLHKINLLSEASQPVSHHSGSVVTSTKQVLSDVALMRTQSLTCNSSKALTRRQSGRTELNLSPSGKLEEKRGISFNLAMYSSNQQSGGRLSTSLSMMSRPAQKGAALRGDLAVSMEKETVQASPRTRRYEKFMKSRSVPHTEIEGLPPFPSSQFDARVVGAFAQKNPHNKVMELREIERKYEYSPEGHSISIPEFLDSRSSVSNTVKSNWQFRAKDLLDAFDSPHDTNSWLSTVDERWAGPSFFNSPPPSSLPLPRFTTKLSRTTATSPGATNDGASQSLIGPFPEVKEIGLATKDLRRLLHLDHASCET